MEEWWVLHLFINKIFAKCKKSIMTDCEGRETTVVELLLGNSSSHGDQVVFVLLPVVFVLLPPSSPFSPKQFNVFLQYISFFQMDT